MTIALIDSDTPIFATALVSEDIDLALAKSRLDRSIETIIKDSGCDSYILFVSGGNNFRKEIDPSYKANRTLPDPKWRKDLRLHLITKWDAVDCFNYEADDGCGISQRDDTIICGIDKDLLQIPGLHYQWPIIRQGNVVREGRFIEIDEEQGCRNFFTQALTGDKSDNIKGIDGIGPKKAEKILAECHTEKDMYRKCLDIYLKDKTTDDEIDYEYNRLHNNLDLLWIWRSLGITYTIRRDLAEESFPC